MNANRIDEANFMRLIAAAALLAVTPVPADAQDSYPSHAVRIIVPYAPGGIADVLARLLGEKLTAKWRKVFIVENRPGASGNIGLRADVARGAGAVLDDEHLTPFGRQLLTQEASQHVRYSAWGIRHDDPDRMAWVAVLRARWNGRDGQKRRRGNQPHEVRCIYSVRIHGLSCVVVCGSSRRRSSATFDEGEFGSEPRECLDADVPVFRRDTTVR